MISAPLLEIQNLKTYYFMRDSVIKAVDDVSFKLKKGEALGLVGESGCGKTTLGFSILRLVPPPGKIVGGTLFFKGENLLQKNDEEMRRLRGKKIAMVFQDPMASLNPLLKVGDHIVEALLVHENVSKTQAWEKTRQIIKALGIPPKRAQDYPHQFSGGMRQRIMIALALALQPDLIIGDEITTALDVIVQKQTVNLLKDLERSEQSLSWIFITHNMGIVAEMCHKIIVMYAGKIVEYADVKSLYKTPFHPYTRGLINSIPKVQILDDSLQSIPGSPPTLSNPPLGCRFHLRCPYAVKICKKVDPPLIQVNSDHYVYCHLAGKI